MIRPYFESVIVEASGANRLLETETLQKLWSGYGEIIRCFLAGGKYKSVVVKHVQLATNAEHPRGWKTNIGHQRKLESYRVETHWYEKYSALSKARLPECLAIAHADNEVLMVLEDLNAAGYPLRRQALAPEEWKACVAWLAEFHASYMGESPEGLWKTGTYWHLKTRPEELEALNDADLKQAAPLIDAKLNNCKHQTLVHGDAKLANFCFSESGAVAALDFQYVGGGCGMKDLAYFVGSCFNEEQCERLEPELLNTYFHYLQRALPREKSALEEEWRALYPVAWADFYRFLKGWSSKHWKINGYGERVTREVIKSL